MKALRRAHSQTEIFHPCAVGFRMPRFSRKTVIAQANLFADRQPLCNY